MANSKKVSTEWKPQLPPFRKFKQAAIEEEKLVSSFIYRVGDSDMLRQESAKVALDQLAMPEYKKKIAYLKKCLLKYRKLTNKGRAIASVQVGIPEQILAIYTPEQKQKIWILINPQIIKQSAELLCYPEMCMSANGLIASVTRPAWVKVVYYDDKGEHIWNTSDKTPVGRMYNRVLQHEIDHLHGIINIDLVPSNKLVFLADPHFYEKATFEEVKT